MPTISETATLNLNGLNMTEYQGVGPESGLQDRLALFHAAFRAHALSHSFEEMQFKGRKGYVGRVSVTGMLRELFAGKISDDDRLKQFAKSMQNSADRHGLINCVDGSDRLAGKDPIWWVADSYEEVTGHPPLQAPVKPERKTKAKTEKTVYGTEGKPRKRTATGKKRNRKPPQSTLDRMYRVRAVLDDVGGKYDTALTYQEIREELQARGDVYDSHSQVVTAVDLLAVEGQAKTRQMSKADKEAIRAAGGNAPGGIPSRIVMLKKNMTNGEIPTLLGTLEQLRAMEDEKPAPPQEATVAPREPEEVTTEEVPVEETPVAPEATVETREERAERQTVEMLQDMYKAVMERADRLEAENKTLRRAVDGLLATIEITTKG